jgi:hypothetical protein
VGAAEWPTRHARLSAHGLPRLGRVDEDGDGTGALDSGRGTVFYLSFLFSYFCFLFQIFKFKPDSTVCFEFLIPNLKHNPNVNINPAIFNSIIYSPSHYLILPFSFSNFCLYFHL